jgi:hypothetical protein
MTATMTRGCPRVRSNNDTPRMSYSQRLWPEQARISQLVSELKREGLPLWRPI